ncbi:MAG: TonB-dependent receptor [Sphingobium sp.]|nr:TonB-dependent receptor [Sphingobium sp.]
MKLNWLLAGVAAAQVVTPAYAQNRDAAQASEKANAASPPADSVGDEIIVTAQKRAQNLRDVPIAISAISGDSLQTSGTTRVSDLGTAVPNAQAGATLGVTSVFLRGIGNSDLSLGSDGSIAYYADGVYIARPRAQTASFFDVERIEIVRGPQGDLYGRNATGGAINVITRKPGDTFGGNLQASYGNYDAVNVQGGVDVPLVPGVISARVAGYYNDHSGYGKNLATGRDIDNQHEYAGRVTLVAKPTSDLSIELIGDYFKANDRLGGWHYLAQGRPDVPLTAALVGGTIAPNPRDIANETDPLRVQESYGVTGTIKYDLSNALTLKSITAYRESNSNIASGLSGGTGVGLDLHQKEGQNQFSQELQLLADLDRLQLVLGAYYFHERIDGDVFLTLPTVPVPILRQQGYGEADAYALFANANFKLTDRLAVIGGLRYSYEKKQSVGAFTLLPAAAVPTGGDKGWSAVTPKIVVQYKPIDNLMVYASASNGFKSGAFTIGVPGPAVNPEKLWSYEVGLKASALDGALQANLAAFYYDYTDLVVFKVVGVTTITQNAAKARNKGFEAELVARPNGNWRFTGSFGYLDARYTEYSTSDPVYPGTPAQDLNGKRLSRAPEFSVRVGAEYGVDIGRGRLTISSDLSMKSKTFFTPFNDRNAYQPSYTLVNAQIGYKSDRGWRIGVFGNNLTDKTVREYSIVSSDILGYPRLGSLNAPRTYGVQLGWDF